jgi:hypothetical protein
MCSYYLTEEASRKRMAALVARLAAEAIDLGAGGVTWPPESDAWKVPEHVRLEAARRGA